VKGSNICTGEHWFPSYLPLLCSFIHSFVYGICKLQTFTPNITNSRRAGHSKGKPYKGPQIQAQRLWTRSKQLCHGKKIMMFSDTTHIYLIHLLYKMGSLSNHAHWMLQLMPNRLLVFSSTDSPNHLGMAWPRFCRYHLIIIFG
jgi:hypothetical protein